MIILKTVDVGKKDLLKFIKLLTHKEFQIYILLEALNFINIEKIDLLSLLVYIPLEAFNLCSYLYIFLLLMRFFFLSWFKILHPHKHISLFLMNCMCIK